MTIRRLPSVIVVVALALLAAACGGAAASGPIGGSAQPGSDGATGGPSGPAGSIAAGGGEVPGGSIAAGLRPACDMLTPAEVGSVLGRTVGPGEAQGSLICEWGREPGEFGGDVSLLAQPLPDEYCEPALDGDPVAGFGRAATWTYSASFDIPQGALAACVSGGLLMVTLTGDVGDASDEPGYRSRAEALMQLALDHL